MSPSLHLFFFCVREGKCSAQIYLSGVSRVRVLFQRTFISVNGLYRMAACPYLRVSSFSKSYHDWQPQKPCPEFLSCQICAQVQQYQPSTAVSILRPRSLNPTSHTHNSSVTTSHTLQFTSNMIWEVWAASLGRHMSSAQHS